jgi:hypothetical protein
MSSFGESMMIAAPKKALSLLVGTLLLSAAVPGGSGAAAELQVLSVSPAALRPASRADADLEWFGTQKEFYFHNIDFDNRYDRECYASLYLPHRARIKSLVVTYMDRGCAQAQDIWVTLVRHKLSSGLVQKMAEVSSRGLEIDSARKTLEDATIDHGLVDNRLYSYSLLVRFNTIKRDRVRFHGAKILFE